jgi:hypothetical protein
MILAFIALARVSDSLVEPIAFCLILPLVPPMSTHDEAVRLAGPCNDCADDSGDFEVVIKGIPLGPRMLVSVPASTEGRRSFAVWVAAKYRLNYIKQPKYSRRERREDANKLVHWVKRQMFRDKRGLSKHVSLVLDQPRS